MTHAEKCHRHELKRKRRRRAVREAARTKDAFKYGTSPNHQAKYPPVAQVKASRDLEGIRQHGTRSQKKQLKEEEGAR